MRNQLQTSIGALLSAGALVLAACSETATAPRTGAKADVVAAAAIPITACGTQITAPGTYVLANDLNCTSTAIVIAKSYVTLKLNGHTISGLGPSYRGGGASDFGILVNNPTGGDVGYVRIEGPGTIKWFTVGIQFAYVVRSTVDGVRLTRNVHGFSLGYGFVYNTKLSANDSILRTVFWENEGHGATINGVLNAAFVDDTAGFNGIGNYFGTGIYVYSGQGITVKRSVMMKNATYGVLVEGGSLGNSFLENKSSNNVISDLTDNNLSCGTNVWTSNTFGTASQSCIH